MQTKQEIIASLIPALAQGLIVSADWSPSKLAQQAFEKAEAIYAAGVQRGIYVEEMIPREAIDRLMLWCNDPNAPVDVLKAVRSVNDWLKAPA